MKIITNRGCSYFVEDLATVELGSMIFDTEENKMYIVLEPNTLTEIDAAAIPVETLEALTEAIAAGGNIAVEANIDAPTGFVITADTTVINNGELSISEDTVGDGVFKVTDGTLTLDGKGTINGLDKSGWSMAIWATDNGKVIIKDGYFTNVGAYSPEDSEHYDLIYASGNGQIEILGGEFKCETPKWVLNIKNADRETASIVVKGGKFHGFNPMEAEEGNLVAPGYKVVENDGIFEVIPE
ncbi:MAG: hypothetical protein J6R25_05090 [Bacteroidales bacterium]|nr:hypothetical protein [Bacteroidales bacterium]